MLIQVPILFYSFPYIIMAYFNQERKAQIKPQINKILKKYWLKWSLKVINFSKVVCTIKSGIIDFQKSYIWKNPEFRDNINVYRIDENREWKAKECLKELYAALNWVGSDIKNYDNSDIMSDYFDVGRYIDIELGSRNKPYILQ